MKNSANMGYVKHTLQDYSLSFKVQIIEEIEQAHLTKSQAETKYGKFD